MRHSPCARSMLGRASRQTARRSLPKQGRYATHPAHRPCLGGFAMPEQRMRAILAQRPGLGEMRVRKVPAWERYQKGPTHLPAQTQTTKVGIIPASLPGRDVVQKQGQNSSPSIEFFPSRDGAQPTPARLPRPTPPSQAETTWRRTGPRLYSSWARLRASRHRQDGRVRLSLPMRAASTSC